MLHCKNTMGKEVTAKVEKNRLVFGDEITVPVDQIFVDHPDDPAAKVTAFNSESFPWITLWFYRVEHGALICDVCNFKPAVPGRGNFPPEISNVWKNNGMQAQPASKVPKIILFHDSPKVSELVQFEIKKRISDTSPRPAARPKPVAFPEPIPRPQPPKEFTQEVSFTIPLEHIRFADGAVEIKREIYFENLRRRLRLCFRVENRFFSPKLNCIRPYLTKALGGVPVTVNALVRIRNGEAIVEEAKAPALDRISSELLSQVRFNYVKGELKNRSGKRITTARRFFGELAEAGFDESDADFVADIVRAKNVKHSPQIEYLAGRHDGSQIRLRLVRDPFSFLFFIPNESGCFFAWETLDGTDATYIWKLKPLSYYLDNNRDELKKSLNEVERTIDIIHASGRNDYLKTAPENFLRIFHDYEDENGFEHWQQEINRVL